MVGGNEDLGMFSTALEVCTVFSMTLKPRFSAAYVPSRTEEPAAVLFAVKAGCPDSAKLYLPVPSPGTIDAA